MTQLTNPTPLQTMDVSFAQYVRRKQAKESAHLQNGVPDYAFALDCELRSRLNAIPHFYSLSKKLTSTYLMREIETTNQYALAVGPNQFPEIYRMGVDCADRLGIGIPNIFIENNQSINAYTIATDDVSPMIVIYSGLLERFTKGELKCVIAHECGHIHNNHSIYQSIIRTLFSCIPGDLSALGGAFLMQFWDRAAEITADRAALICADDPQDELMVNAKLMYGAAMNTEAAINLDAILKQLEQTLQNPTKVIEILNGHPSTARRIACEQEYLRCSTLYRWRPEWKKPDTVMNAPDVTDERCKKYVNILNNQ